MVSLRLMILLVHFCIGGSNAVPKALDKAKMARNKLKNVLKNSASERTEKIDQSNKTKDNSSVVIEVDKKKKEHFTERQQIEIEIISFL